MPLHREITDDQLLRYARHIILDEVGEEGQLQLLNARVLVIGAGGRGSPLLLYLAAAGVGTLGVVDFDVVDISNLQRQILHATDRVGLSKVDSAVAAIRAVNPEIVVQEHKEKLTAANAVALVSEYDVVADGSDNFTTRYLVNDACHLAARLWPARYSGSKGSSPPSNPISATTTRVIAACFQARPRPA